MADERRTVLAVMLLANQLKPVMSQKLRPNEFNQIPGRNARVESFFATLKRERIYRRRYRSRAQARADLFDYIEVFYNRQRWHSLLGHRSPAAYEVDLVDLH